MKVSIVLLSFNRPDEIYRNVKELYHLIEKGIEIIVVDNGSKIPVVEVCRGSFPRVKFIRMRENLGVGGRNLGIKEASGNYVITLDDDVFGLEISQIEEIVDVFEACPDVAAINFRIVDDMTEELVNWIHHRDPNQWVHKSFDTYEISEGACAFRRSVFLDAGGYPEYFFISHEGPDLALRILDAGFKVIFYPSVIVRHAHSETARVAWRRYYFDTRNLIWLGVRNLPVGLLLKSMFIGVGSQFLYSVRDGYISYWFRGIRDAFLKIKEVKKDRNVISSETVLRYREMQTHNISYLKLLKKRIFTRRGIRI